MTNHLSMSSHPGMVAPVSPPARAQHRTGSSLARKYSQFTAVLLVWVAFVFFAYDLQRDRLDWVKMGFLAILVPLVAVAISKFTNHLLAKPLVRLQQGITAVREGRLEPIRVSRTGDEVEYLGESLNEMIQALKESREEVGQYQELLEERIHQRTEALQEATQRALAASRAKSEFLANISHELRTPMNGILGMIDIVLDEDPSTGQREQLETAKSCANTLLSLLNNLLDLSKIEAGKMLLENVHFDVAALAEDCIRSMVPRARQKGIVIRVNLDSNLPALVAGDSLRIRQILNNLLSNAVKFTDQGSVELRVSARHLDQPDRLALSLVVEDTGLGIPKDKLAAIFEEFTQADGSVSRRYGGTGLGLTITRKLVELHQGTIHVESEPGKGSSFHVQVEVGTVEVTPPVVLPDVQPAASSDEGPLAPTARLLVAEDNLVNQKVVSTVLKKHGYHVHLASNGRDAVEALEREHFDLVLMDVQMPEMDGITAARRIRQNPRWQRLPIIAMTAHAMKGDRERCLQAGMNEYLSKPVAPNHLMDAVKHHLQDSQLPAPPEPPPPATLPSPIDRKLANRLMDDDTGLMAGMTLLFLQLAPERLQKLQSAAIRTDTVLLESQSLKMARAAERIAALEIARCAQAIADAAPNRDYAQLSDLLAGLIAEIDRLDRHVRLRQDKDAEVPVG